MAETRTCPFCGEVIAAAAAQCRYCGERLTGGPSAGPAAPPPPPPPPPAAYMPTPPSPPPGIYAPVQGPPPNPMPPFLVSLIGLFVCNIACPFGWYLAVQYERECHARGLPVEGLGTAAKVIGIIGTVLAAIGLVCGGIWLVFGVLATASGGRF